jgi:acyl-CoA synthetase (AMP-forming)/AMP-acid ligase II
MPVAGPPLEGPVRLAEILKLGLATKADEEALVSTAKRVTWRELDQTTDRLAGNYLALGLKPGDRLASLMPNRVDLVIHYLACMKAGLVVTPLNYRYMPPEIDHALGLSGASILFAHAERAADIAASGTPARYPAS